MKLIDFLNEGNKKMKIPNISSLKMLSSINESFEDLPVSVNTSEWLVYSDPERLSRTFEFENIQHMKYFIDELIAYQEEKNHHSKITIDHRDIVVETYTKDFNGITGQDKRLASYCDEVYSDIKFINTGKTI